MDSKNDAELVHLSRAGNRDAYGELIRRYQHSIRSLACSLNCNSGFGRQWRACLQSTGCHSRCFTSMV